MTDLPMEGRSQEIGRLAGNAFGVKTPKAWIPHPQDGDTDFGIDYLIQVKSDHGQVSFSFYLQLKGTTTPQYDKDKSHISYDFKTKTLNYYHQQEPLVMVAVVDLINEDRLWECPIYYYWLDDSWFDQHKEKLSNQKSISVKIPVSNILDNTLDIYTFYSRRIKEKLAVAELKKEIELQNFPVAKGIESIAEAINNKPVLLKSIEEKSDVPWLHNPNGTTANELKRCSESISSNNIQLAENILEKLETNISLLTKNEVAELHYQRGSIFTLKGDLEEAEHSYHQSFNEYPKERYLLGYFEAKFKYEQLPNPEVLEEMVNALDDSTYQKCQTKAKCLSLLGRADEALDSLSAHYPDKFIGQMLICTISGKTERLDEIISEKNSQKFEEDRDSYIFHSVCARRFLFKATDGTIANEAVLPIQGMPSYDLDLMKQALKSAKIAWDSAKNIGYPADITMLVDASILIFGYFNLFEELMKHIDVILTERPQNKEIIRPYTRLLFNLGKFDKVNELLNNIGELDEEDCGLAIMSNYNLGNLTVAYGLVRKHENELLKSKSPDVPMIFCLASEIANDLLEVAVAQKYEKIVEKLDDGPALLAVRKFISDCNKHREKRKEFAQELYQSFNKLGRSIIVAEQLFRYLDSEEHKTAEQVIELGTLLAENRELSNSDYSHLAQAFMTTNSWEEAKALADKNICKGIDVSNWKLILAAAERQLGNVGLALKLINEALSLNKNSRSQKVFYVNLSLSLGLGETVIESVKELLVSTTKREEKVEFLRILISVYSNNEDWSNELRTAIDKLGEIVDQSNCEEEGLYLLYFLTSPTTEIDDNKVSEFQARLRRYTESFPDSPILRSGTIDLEGGADSVVKSMQDLAGVSDEQIERWEKNRRALRNGTLPVPFSMRERFLRDTRDIFTTWAYSINYPEEFMEFQIKHAPQTENSRFIEAFNKVDTVILEETTLLALNELGLLEAFLETVQNVTLLRSVYEQINQSTHSLGGSLNTHTPKQILTTLQNNIEKIRLLDVDGDNPIEKYICCLKSGNAFLLTDDLYLLTHLSREASQFETGNLFNVLELLFSNNKITKDMLHESVSSACELGIFEPNMRLDFLYESINHYLDIINGVDYSQTRFKPIFEKLFAVKRDSMFCFDLLFRMLSPIEGKTELHPSTLLAMFRSFLIRHPIKDLGSMIALWFLNSCVRAETTEVDVSGRSESLHKLWLEYESLMMLENNAKTDLKSMLQNVVRELQYLDDEVSNKVYKTVKQCFIPATQESEMFEGIYQEFAYTRAISRASKTLSV